MRLTTKRLEESFDLISKYLVKCHTDKDGDSLFVRFSEIFGEIEDLQSDVRSCKSMLKILTKHKDNNE